MLSNTLDELMSVKRHQRGVTLIELMTVMVVLAILASIAVPSYRRYLIRSQRTDATRALLQIQANEEKYYLQYNGYTSDITGSQTANPPGLGMSDVSPQGFYKIEVTPPGAGLQTYTITATPISGKGQQDDKQCTTLTLTDAGTQGATGSASDPKTCWK